jgi:hypothetical protein
MSETKGESEEPSVFSLKDTASREKMQVPGGKLPGKWGQPGQKMALFNKVITKRSTVVPKLAKVKNQP